MAKPDQKTVAAIAAALHLYLGEVVHDKESYVITIRNNESGWNSPFFSFRKKVAGK